MLSDRTLGNVADGGDAGEWAGRRRDPVDLKWHECGRRALRAVTRAGRPVRTLLPPGVTLRHGDVLADDGDAIVVVNVVPTEVLVVGPRGPEEMGRVGLEVGNLHAPAAVDGGELLVIPDGPVEAVLAHLGTPYDRQVRRFVPLRTVGGPAVRPAADFLVTGSLEGRDGEAGQGLLPLARNLPNG